jgi:hypothetical protein
MTYHWDLLQGSDAWLLTRLGKVTSSGAANVLPLRDFFPSDKGKDNEKSRKDYALRLAVERVTGLPADASFSSVAMERGTALEPQARTVYQERHLDHEVRECGFVDYDTLCAGDSPDGLCLVGGSVAGGVEVKCPGPVVHWEYREAGIVPREYLRQMVHHLWAVPEAQWWDFVSYHPGFPGASAWFEIRLTREAAQPWLDTYDAAVLSFLQTVDALEQRMREGV